MVRVPYGLTIAVIALLSAGTARAQTAPAAPPPPQEAQGFPLQPGQAAPPNVQYDGPYAPQSAPQLAPQSAPEYAPQDDGQYDPGDADPRALNDFRPALDPYGSWVDDPNYGTVWVPDANIVGADFTPYTTGGYWGYDGGQYVWVSAYPWGWAPFHYGRWANLGGRWGWVPGRRYAPAWVSWNNGHWGPMAPAFGWRNGRAFGMRGGRSFVGGYPGRGGGRVFGPGYGRGFAHPGRAYAAPRGGGMRGFARPSFGGQVGVHRGGGGHFSRGGGGFSHGGGVGFAHGGGHGGRR
jgi:hypothetical protein